MKNVPTVKGNMPFLMQFVFIYLFCCCFRNSWCKLKLTSVTTLPLCLYQACQYVVMKSNSAQYEIIRAARASRWSFISHPLHHKYSACTGTCMSQKRIVLYKKIQSSMFLIECWVNVVFGCWVRQVTYHNSQYDTIPLVQCKFGCLPAEIQSKSG